MALSILGSTDFSKKMLPYREGEYMHLHSDETGPVLVVFYSPTCPNCKHLIPEIEKVAMHRLVRVGLCNVSDDLGFVSMSKFTICEVKYVPLLVMYNHGRPVITYDGPLEYEPLMAFVEDVLADLAKPTSQPPQPPPASASASAPAPAPAQQGSSSTRSAAPQQKPASVTGYLPAPASRQRYSTFRAAYG
jgi:thioredoxin-like negative regulator of GroEL